jgi:cold shock CspA family protein
MLAEWHERLREAVEVAAKRACIAQPYTFVLRPDLGIHKLYNGWWFVGRPTVEELRHDLRTIMEARADYHYEAYDTPEVRQVRIPQQEWANGAPALGASGLPVRRGVVRWFDGNAGVGEITDDETGRAVFFHFTAMPGQGYRTIQPGTAIAFEMIETPAGPSARNIQPTRA